MRFTKSSPNKRKGFKLIRRISRHREKMPKETCHILLISQETFSKIEQKFLPKPKFFYILYLLHRKDRISKKPFHATVPLTFHYLSTYFYSCITVIDSLHRFFPLINGTFFKGKAYCTYSKCPLFLPLTHQKDLFSS